MRLHFQFPHKIIDIELVLLDHPGVQSWVRQFRGRSVEAFMQNRVLKLPYDLSIVKKELLEIDTQIQTLADYGVDFLPCGVPSAAQLTAAQLDQSWCNYAHRWFTHQEQCAKENDAWKGPIGSALESINLSIHRLELRLRSPIQDRFPDGIWDWELTDSMSSLDPNWWHIDPAWPDNHTQQHYDVILGSQILGKTVLRSYLDQDDPNDWDTSGHYCNNAGLVLLIDDKRSQIYRSDEFQSWARSHGCDPVRLRCDWPIGNVRDRSQIQYLTKTYHDMIKKNSHTESTSITVSFQ